MKRKRRASSIAQRNLMGYAYACASGKAKNCPPSIKSVAKSFTKKDKEKGLSSLRAFAKTKHDGLPYKVTESIIKFKDFIMNEKLKEETDVITFLYSLKNQDVIGYVNDFLSADSRDKSEYIEDILLEIGNLVGDDDYNWVSKELKKH